MITEQEIDLCRSCLDYAREAGASKSRVNLCKSHMELVAVLDGGVDKVTSCQDRSITVSLFVDGRYGNFSTNKLSESSLRAFIFKAADTVRMLAPDPCRDLPDQSRVEKDAVSGREMGLLDERYFDVTPQDRIRMALQMSTDGEGLVSQEGEYSDEIYDNLIMDSQGTFCRQTETSFSCYMEVTVSDGKGNLLSSDWWDESPRIDGIDLAGCGRTAYRNAVAKRGPHSCRSRKCNMVVDSNVASRVVSPVLRALSGYSIQQHDSFLEGKLGQKVFPEGMTITDEGRRKGSSNSRSFDSEGVATVERNIIDKGVIKEYFLNTYMSNKLGMPATAESAVRPRIPAWPGKGTSRDDILRLCGEGILVTDFNGGNSNSATGDFSFGVEGFVFKDGKIMWPVREMLVTGNFTELWNNFIAAADDARECMSKLIPTLAFSNVDFSG